MLARPNDSLYLPILDITQNLQHGESNMNARLWAIAAMLLAVAKVLATLGYKNMSVNNST